MLRKLVLFQKKIVRILTNSDYLAHTKPLFKLTGILELNDLFIYNAQLLMYKTLILNRNYAMSFTILNSQTGHEHATRIFH